MTCACAQTHRHTYHITRLFLSSFRVFFFRKKVFSWFIGIDYRYVSSSCFDPICYYCYYIIKTLLSQLLTLLFCLFSERCQSSTSFFHSSSRSDLILGTDIKTSLNWCSKSTGICLWKSWEFLMTVSLPSTSTNVYVASLHYVHLRFWFQIVSLKKIIIQCLSGINYIITCLRFLPFPPPNFLWWNSL